MEIKDQVANFELSKKLFELGFKEEHLLSWMLLLNDESKKECKTIHLVFEGRHQKTIYYEPEYGFINDDDVYITKEYPAYTVGELGVLLPKEIEHNLNDWSSYFISFGNDGVNEQPGVWYMDNDLWGDDEILHGTGAKTEADARAQMLIWLIENGKIKIDEKI